MWCLCGHFNLYSLPQQLHIKQGQYKNFQSSILDFKDTNDLVCFDSLDREFHILGPIKERVSMIVFPLLTLGTGMAFVFPIGRFHSL